MIRENSHKEIANKIINFCKDKKYRFIFIAGNGGSGKSSFSKLLVQLFKEQGISTNQIDTDEFLLNSELRKNANKERIDKNNKKRLSYYSSAFKESYNLSQLESIIYSLEQQTNCFYKSKHDQTYIKLDHTHPFTIIEGIGTIFLQKQINTLSVWIGCDEKTEIKRRIKRSRNGEREVNYEELQQKTRERNEQLETNTIHKPLKFDIIIDSSNDDIFIIKEDKLNFL